LKVIPEEELAAYMADHKMRRFRVDDDDHETDDHEDHTY
jgi:hypothetical protein